MSLKSSRVMLEEMRHSFDTVYGSVRKFNDKTFMELGAELGFLLFYLSGDELENLKALFCDKSSGWYIFAIIAALAFITATVLFIIASVIGRI